MRSSNPRLTAVGAAAALALVAAVPTAAQDQDGSVVVTTEVLGSVVEQLVGQSAEVTVIMPSGANPHSYEPSARDAERMLEADVLVSNGLGLEEALVPILETAEEEGVTWFQAAEHVAIIDVDDGEHDEDEDHAHDTEADHDEEGHDEDGDHAHDEEADHDEDEDHAHEHDHGAEDPHIWTDPTAMIEVVEALEPVLLEAGIDVSIGADELVADLQALDAEVGEIVAVVPEKGRKLVTGHESLGYFADRYGFELVGTVIPGLTTSGEPTAREMSQLIEDIRANDVRAVFAEVGTPQAVAEAVASDSGAELVSLNTSQLPDDGDYQALILEIAMTVADALTDEAR